DKARAMNLLMEAHANEEVLTGVFYVNTQKPDFTEMLNMVDDPLATLSPERVRPSREVLAEIMAEHG
ncbi:MAG: 2-oxoacid:ferredoxin oxidoreductase subunit beta, partial [Acidobacteriaceae bacterium]